MKGIVFVISAVLTLAGCASVGGAPVHEVGRRLNGPPMTVEAPWPSYFADRTLNDTRQRQLRREYAYHLIAVSDRRCEDYLIALSAGNNTTRSGLDILAVLLSGAASGSSTLGSATDLASGSTVIQTIRSSLDDNIFGGNEFALIYETVHVGRKAEADALSLAIEAGAYDTWSAEGILSQINAYDVKCGLNYAMRLIGDAVREATPTASVSTPAATTPVPLTGG